MSLTLQEYLSKLVDTESTLPVPPVLRQPPVCPPTLPNDFSAILLADQVTPSLEEVGKRMAEEAAKTKQETKGTVKLKRKVTDETPKLKRTVKKIKIKELQSDEVKRKEDQPSQPEVTEKIEEEKEKKNKVPETAREEGTLSSFSESFEEWTIQQQSLSVGSTRRQQPPSDQLKQPARGNIRPVRQPETMNSRPDPLRAPQTSKSTMSRIFPIPSLPDLPLDQKIRATFKPERGTLTPLRPQIRVVTSSGPNSPQTQATAMASRSNASIQIRDTPNPLKAVLRPPMSFSQRLPQKAPLPRLIQARAPSPRPLDPSSAKLVIRQYTPSKDKLLSQTPLHEVSSSGVTSRAIVKPGSSSQPNWTEILAGNEEEMSLAEAVTLLENTPDAKHILQYIASSLEDGQNTGQVQISFGDFEATK
ncbi:hypothetical protein QYM36_000862 [Artemia franciscana]|nr:hypothetical protein QYM36_000862 [Artemia franciscana]